MRITLVHNPSAGEEPVDADALCSLFESRGHVVVYASVEAPGWESAMRERADVVVVVGGDGTVAEVFTALDGSSTTAAIVPTGSANNVATSLGLAGTDLRFVRGETARRTFDVWEARTAHGSSRFVEAFGGGVLATMLARAGQIEPEPAGEEKRRAGLEILRDVLADAEPETWAVELDGRALELELLAVEAMNVDRIGPKLVVAPAADSGDGFLDVVLVKPDDRASLAAYVEAELRGDGGEVPSLEIHRAARIGLRPPASANLHRDDEPVPSGDRDVELTRAAIDLTLLV